MDTISEGKRIITRRHEHWLIKFYNTINHEQPVGCIEEIPDHVRDFLAFMDFHDLVKPFLAQDIRGGASRDQAAIKYGVTPGYAREVGRRFGFLPRSKKTGS